jgi:hypothetical protein
MKRFRTLFSRHGAVLFNLAAAAPATRRLANLFATWHERLRTSH